MVSFKPKRATPIVAPALSAVSDRATPNDLIVVARIGVAYGIKGWVKLHPFSHSPDALESAKTWWMAPYLPNQTEVPDTAWRALQVTGFKPHSDTWVAQFQSWTDRSHAEAHKGWQIAVSRADFPQTGDDEFYWVDLIGAHVTNQDGAVLGVLTGLLESAAHPVMNVKGETAEYLIPFVGAFVGEVDTAAKTIQVNLDVDATA